MKSWLLVFALLGLVVQDVVVTPEPGFRPVLLSPSNMKDVLATPESGFRPVFAFPYLLGHRDGKSGEKHALETKTLPQTPTRFEFQRACYIFIYGLLESNPSLMEEPKKLHDSLTHECVQDDKKDCGVWADELVSVLEKKETEVSKHHQRHYARSRNSNNVAAHKHHHREQEEEEQLPHHEKKNHPHHEEKMKRSIRGRAAAKSEEESDVEKLSGKPFVPKKSAGTSGVLKGEVWTPPKPKHHRHGTGLLQEPVGRYDTWCDALYAKGGGVVDKKDKPSSSDMPVTDVAQTASFHAVHEEKKVEEKKEEKKEVEVTKEEKKEVDTKKEEKKVEEKVEKKVEKTEEKKEEKTVEKTEEKTAEKKEENEAKKTEEKKEENKDAKKTETKK